MDGFSIDFGTIKLNWTLYNTILCKRWAEKLAYMSKHSPIDDPRRFYGLPATTAFELYTKIIDAIYLLKNLNQDLTEYIVKFEEIDQNWLNILHDKFANMHGRDNDEKSKFMEQDLIDAWNLLHINLHRLEAKIEGRSEGKRIVGTWRYQGDVMENFSIYDYDHFTPYSNFGDVFLNYREVGKTPYEVFLSNDQLSLDVCVPSQHWCADFKIIFTHIDQRNPSFKLDEFNQWYENNFAFFSKNYLFYPNDKRVGLGAYPLAFINTAYTQDEIVSKLSTSSGIQNIEVF